MSVGIFCLTAATIVEGSDRVELLGSDFSQWLGSTGDWQIAGDALTNPQDEKLLSAKPGSGVIVNGPTGKTINILSKAEFGDVRAQSSLWCRRGRIPACILWAGTRSRFSIAGA